MGPCEYSLAIEDQDVDLNPLDLQAAIDELEWYHTIELAPGVVTPGWFDTRAVSAEVPFPASLAGKRCLDVGTFDGFWAFEMERRGAAEVVAIDILDPVQWDWPAASTAEAFKEISKRKARGQGFEIAHSALKSSVKRMERSVYDLNPEEFGQFDLVYVGSLLLHLQNPVRALEAVRSVCKGTVIVLDAVDLFLSVMHPTTPVATLDGRGRPWWWAPNQAGLERMVEVAGFEIVQPPKRVFMKPGKGQAVASFSPKLLRNRHGWLALVTAYRGDPHAVLVGRPVAMEPVAAASDRRTKAEAG